MNPVIITGATGSMGAVAVKNLASRGCPVIMACRNLQKAESVRDNILAGIPSATLEIMHLDLDSRKSVNEFAESLAGRRLSGLFNNAGVISRSFSLTEDGLEHTLAVNFVNPALLSMRLLPLFEDGAHVVNMVSLTTKLTKLGPDWADPDSALPYSRLRVYSKSKLAFLLFSIAFARRNPHLIVNVSDPGVVDSNMITMGKWFDPIADALFRPFISSPEKGASPALHALEAQHSLDYYVGRRHDSIPRRFMSNPLCDELFDYIGGLV